MVNTYFPEYLEQCAKLFMETFNAQPWNDRWTITSASKYLKEFSDDGRFAGFTLWKSGEVIGVAFCHARTWWEADELFIDEFFVSADYQRHGYGGTLMNAITDYCRENEIKSMVLLTNKHTPANEFYIRNGFSVLENIRLLYRSVD